ncbi:hypothetical protein GUITHDRAFT_113906 [Guillardia theta CCMP2712]|uniref:Uncharacterized protein n=1 Tax=Guillardia theta (strain CCMP2712) TaxID=905079 RepID=L1IVJ6_GUITC|nr:hypothetical protein GUITHDRAFT_113906 [Guillardia theta CCMP2712]EKX39914.1 hypothetical protein GUITHDRAFT_113906 [Guillardia theta CCMP2712]|eukprot:XP_005826894.1 hypothetical protein GUITHDRAFT_113906 [Guillardia theta CCMP2712]
MWPLHHSNESFKNVFVKSGDYICFEITESTSKIPEKIYQLSRLYVVLKDSGFIGKSSRIAAMGIIVDSDREEFPIAAEKARNFLKGVANTPDLAKNMINSSIPTFLLHVPMPNIYSSIERLKEDGLPKQIEELANGEDEMKIEMKKQMAELANGQEQMKIDQEQMKIEMKKQMAELANGQDQQMQELKLCIQGLVNGQGQFKKQVEQSRLCVKRLIESPQALTTLSDMEQPLKNYSCACFSSEKFLVFSKCRTIWHSIMESTNLGIFEQQLISLVAVADTCLHGLPAPQLVTYQAFPAPGRTFPNMGDGIPDSLGAAAQRKIRGTDGLLQDDALRFLWWLADRSANKETAALDGLQLKASLSFAAIIAGAFRKTFAIGFCSRLMLFKNASDEITSILQWH